MKHDLYKDGDHSIPKEILDRNGQVVLGLCKICDAAEVELEDPCIPESSETIARWAESTFGPATALSTAIRAQKELTELIEMLSLHAEGRVEISSHSVMNEVADIRIVLARIQTFHPNGGTAEEAEQRKMEINRARKWKLDGHGHGQHV